MAWTNLTEEDTRVAAMVSTGRVVREVVATSAQGRDVYVLRIGTPPPTAGDRVGLLLVSLQHGNEPASREACLNFAEHLATTTDEGELEWLTHGVLIMPTANPDGFALFQRNNGNGVDINRRHIQLTEPEAAGIGATLGTYRPLVVIDMHEGNPAANARFLDPTTSQVDSAVRATARALIDIMKTRAQEEGWTHGDFGGGVDEVILRNAVGLRNTVAVLLETPGLGAGADPEALRIAVQTAVAEEAFKYAGQNRANLLTLTSEAGERKTSEGAAGTVPFDLRINTLDPPPLAYQLTASDIAATTAHRHAFTITGGEVISMAQPAQPVIPYLMDALAEFNVISATRLFTLPEGPPPTEPERPDIATANSRTDVTWLACDLVSGRIIAELPEITGQISRVLGNYTSTSLSMPIPRSGPGAIGEVAFEATQPGVTLLVAVVNDIPTWGGIILQRHGGTDATLDLGVVSLEGYLDRRYVGNHRWDEADESAVIAAGLVGDANIQGIGLLVDAPATGTLRSRSYAHGDDATVYQRLRELMAVQGGPEWTIDLDWADTTQQAIVKIFRCRKRIGRVSPTPGAIFQTTAPSVFSSRGISEARYVYVEDYTDGKGANHVITYASGEGDDRPESAPRSDVLPGWPRYERRFSPSSSITNIGVLNSHALADLRLRRDGANTWQIAGRWDTYPRLNLDWRIGDDVGWELTGHRHPHGVIGQGRVIGWDLDLQSGTVSPILWSATDQEVA